MEMFGRIGSSCCAGLAAITLPPVFALPMTSVCQPAELDRLPTPKPPSLGDYWRSYLLATSATTNLTNGLEVTWVL